MSFDGHDVVEANMRLFNRTTPFGVRRARFIATLPCGCHQYELMRIHTTGYTRPDYMFTQIVIAPCATCGESKRE